MVTALVMASIVPGVHLILGDEWLTTHKAKLDYENLTMRFKIRGRVVAMPTISSATKGPTLSGSSEPATAYSTAQLHSETTTHYPILSAISARRALRKGATAFVVDVRKGTFADPPTKHPSPIIGALDASATAIPSNGLVTQEELDAVLLKYKDIFAELPPGLPPDRGARHTIQLVPGAKPPCRPMYRLSPAELKEVTTQIETLLKMGFIEPSDSPYAAPILFVLKKDGTLRMVIDYRAINALTVRNTGPLPLITDLYDKLGGATVFSTLDLASGYHQVLLHPDDVEKTTFRTPLGSYAFRVLPFGLTNSGAVFQAQMNRIFREQLGKYVLCYLDDICVYSRTPEEHLVHLEKVFEILRTNKFFAKQSKCDFNKPELPFLGHIVGRNGLKVDPKKV